MKKFNINCDFGGQLAPFTIYIGKPESTHHPLHFQADWLSKQRGGMIPGEVMDAVAKLQDLAVKNGVSLEELCVYALGAAQKENSVQEGETSSAEEETSYVQEEDSTETEATESENILEDSPANEEKNTEKED